MVLFHGEVIFQSALVGGAKFDHWLIYTTFIFSPFQGRNNKCGLDMVMFSVRRYQFNDVRGSLQFQHFGTSRIVSRLLIFYWGFPENFRNSVLSPGAETVRFRVIRLPKGTSGGYFFSDWWRVSRPKFASELVMQVIFWSCVSLIWADSTHWDGLAHFIVFY